MAEIFNQIPKNQTGCFGSFFKKEMEDTFSCNADASNYNHHIQKHFQPGMPYMSVFRPRSKTGSIDDTDYMRNINDIFYGE